jgi:hypothetical protein
LRSARAVARLVSSAAGSLAIIVGGISTSRSKRIVTRRLSHIWPVPTGLNSTPVTVPSVSVPDARSALVTHSAVSAAGVSAIAGRVTPEAVP